MSERGPEFAAGDVVAGRRHELTAEGTFTGDCPATLSVLFAAPLRDRPRWRRRLDRLLWRWHGRRWTQIGATDDFGDGNSADDS